MITIISYNTTVNELMTVQRYETIRLSERDQDGQYTDVRYEEASTESSTGQYQNVLEIVSIKTEPRSFDITQYVNVPY